MSSSVQVTAAAAGNTQPIRVRPAAAFHQPASFTRSITFHEEEEGSKRQTTKEGGRSKLGTFSGVFVVCTNNVLSILMYLRYGFILGQTGVVGILTMLVVAYTVDVLTVLSLSAVATNGTVRSGGTYYLLSRSLGIEFGGSIGLIFYIGQFFNAALNVLGFVEPLLTNFGSEEGTLANVLPEGPMAETVYGTIMLISCTVVCLVGPKLFARASTVLFAIIVVSIVSVPLSLLFVKPFVSHPPPFINYTGPSWATLKSNLMPKFTSGAAGSAHSSSTESFKSTFAVFFPATAGIFAGASMSGDLKAPNRSIPKGTLSALLVTFLFYFTVILCLGSSVTRETLYRDINVLQNINMSAFVILVGAYSSALFSTLAGVLGCAKLLQAIARDGIFPGLQVFGYGTRKDDNPVFAILLSYIFIQCSLFTNINQIAAFITMAYLLTFIVVNMACFLLKISSAPNFRPTFHFFNWTTAMCGAFTSFICMYFVDGIYATFAIVVSLTVFLFIHYNSPPKEWGDVTQSLIYHQVRKYLLRLDVRKEHVKFWRPQILFLVRNPRSSWQFVQFCNALKKGALYIIGHVILVEDGDFQAHLPELKKQRAAWLDFIQVSNIKAFQQVALSPSVLWGVRNLILNAGLGGLSPNIVVMGAYDRKQQQASKSGVKGDLPTDHIRPEKQISPTAWVNILEDILLGLELNVAVGKGFDNLELPMRAFRWGFKYVSSAKYIDLWPVQMASEVAESGSQSLGAEGGKVLMSIFDTYTMILQLGFVLHSVPAWNSAYRLRLFVFVEHAEDVKEERARVSTLLAHLRIDAILCVLYLNSGEYTTYNTIVNGWQDKSGIVERVLGSEQWYVDLKTDREQGSPVVRKGPPLPRINTDGISSARNRRHSFASVARSLTSPMNMRISLSHPPVDDLHSDSEASEDDGEEELEEDYSRVTSRDLESQAMLSSKQYRGSSSNTESSESTRKVHFTDRSRTHSGLSLRSTEGYHPSFSAVIHPSIAEEEPQQTDPDKPSISFESVKSSTRQSTHPIFSNTQPNPINFNILPSKGKISTTNN